ncbi:MAG TPA: DUF5979 domain-containing protein [Acidimicrobiales bacterium]|nr:DUF5979 domain-containing protein [Acidimicrobiales bacterium]
MGAFVLALALLVGVVPALGGPAAAAEGDPVVVREAGTNGCNGVRPTPGSENTTKRLDPNYPSDLSPGGVVGYIIDFPVDPTDVAGRETFVITDCVFVDDVAIAKYSVSFVPNTEAYELRFTVPVPPDTLLGAQFCNYAKTTAAPSTSQASNRKAGPACFTVGGGLRIEKRSGSASGPILPGAEFAIECRPTTDVPPTIISGLSEPSTTDSNGVVSASGTAGDGTIAIVGPSGTPCTVTETAPPAGHLHDPTPRELVIPVGTSQTIEVFVNEQVSSLTVTKTSDADGSFDFVLDCDDDRYDDTFTIIDSGTVSFDVPVGTECTVTETAHPSFDSSSDPADGTVTVDADGATVAFTNTRKVADLTITKVTNGATGPTFVFDVDCDGTRYTVEIVDEGSATIADLPTGTECTVTERSHGDYTSVVVPADGTVTIDDDGATVAFTNTRKTGDLVITKTTQGGTGTFTFVVDCSGTDFDQTVTITDSGSATIEDLPTGTSCTVTETTDPEFDSAVTPGDGTVVIAVGDNTVAFTNTAKPAALGVVKTADAGTVTAGGAIGFTVTVSSTGTGTVRNARLDDPLPGATGVSWTIAPAYAGPGTCAITGAAPLQVLTCSFGDLAPGATASVHVGSATSALTVGTLPNTATARGDNAPPAADSASIVVKAAAVVLDLVLTRPADVVAAPAPVVQAVVTTLPRTGSSVDGPLRAALLLLVLGGLALMPQHLRRRRPAAGSTAAD